MSENKVEVIGCSECPRPLFLHDMRELQRCVDRKTTREERERQANEEAMKRRKLEDLLAAGPRTETP